MLFIDYVFWADHEHVFSANACVFYIFIIRYCSFSAYYDTIYLSRKDLSASYMEILHICNTWKTRDGRKFVKNFGVLGVSGLNK